MWWMQSTWPPPVLSCLTRGVLENQELLQAGVYLQDTQYQGQNWAFVAEHLTKKTGLFCPSCVLGFKIFKNVYSFGCTSVAARRIFCFDAQTL